MQSQRNPKSGNIVFKILLPIIFIAVAVIFTTVLVILKSKPEQEEISRILPRVEVKTIRSEALVLTIESQGTVMPRTETVLTAEVSGVVESISPKLLTGSFFQKGDILLEIDKTEYEAALANARGMLAAAKLAYAQEK